MGLVRIADHVRELDGAGNDRFSAAYEEALERMLKSLFGACPDCGDDAWDEAAEAFDAEIGRDGAVSFCAERGYDIRRGTMLVVCWRDIGIMLMARDRGLLV
jgi:hypothetical protein